MYLLKCRDGSLYAGIAVDVERRLLAHNAGKGARYTRSRRPVRLVFATVCRTETEARRLEIRVKRLPRKAKLAIVAGDDAVLDAVYAEMGLRRRKPRTPSAPSKRGKADVQTVPPQP